MPQQEFQQPMPIVAKNLGFINEMIMELLQDPRATGDVEATPRLMTTSAQEPQYGRQVDDKVEEEEEEEENEDEEDESGGRNEGN